MRYKLLFLFVLLYSKGALWAQEAQVKKPSYVIIADGQIITRQQLTVYDKNGDVKSMTKGVSQQTRDSLAQKLGDSIGEKEFIIIIGLLSEREKAERAAVAKPDNGVVVKPDSAKPVVGESPLIGKAANDFELSMSDGRVVHLSGFRGKVVMVNFWATWCGPCLMEFYDFPDKLITPFADKPIVLLPIAIGETKKSVLAKMQQLGKDGVRFPVGWDKNDAIWNQLGDKNIPRTVLIDKKGVVRFVSVGNTETSLATIVKKIGELVEE